MYSKLLLLSFVICIFVSCTHEKEYRYEEGIAWNTAYHITYESDNDLSDSILYILKEIDYSISPFNPESVISKINDNRSNITDRHFEIVYDVSRKINHQTGGVFDPTLAPLIRAWGFGQGHKVSAIDTLRIDSLLKLVGINKTNLKNGRLIKSNPEIEFNFSALAKGYGVDCIADMLERNGSNNYLVEVGGEIRASGVNPKRKKWGIGIDRPEENASLGETVYTLYIGSGAIATSGNYRNLQQGKDTHFGHTISPFTGKPIQTDVISATIISDNCMEADALATSCMVIGSRKALDLCNQYNVGLMLIKSDMTVITNEIFKSFTHTDTENL